MNTATYWLVIYRPLPGPELLNYLPASAAELGEAYAAIARIRLVPCESRADALQLGREAYGAIRQLDAYHGILWRVEPEEGPREWPSDRAKGLCPHGQLYDCPKCDA